MALHVAGMAGDNPGQELHDTVGAAPPDEDGLPPEVAEQVPEHIREEMEGLTLADDWMDATVQNSSTETVTLVDRQEGEVYVLELADITWSRVNQALTDALVPSASGDGKLDFGAYYRSVAEAKIQSVQPEVPEEQMATWLTGLNERLGKQLEQHLPDPVDEMSEDREKN